jgi:poly-gamma-glutamate capsule biosynthesis protein CapA/YwtB (metallophosphatase superfamily)
MSKTKPKERKPDRCTLEREVLRAMRAEEWLAPETEEEVLKAETKLVGARVDLPASFERPRDLLRSANKVRAIRLSRSKGGDVEVSENLARAAREGGALSSDVEERMKKDRDAAEAENEDK